MQTSPLAANVILRAAAIYLLSIGVIGLVWPLLSDHAHYPELASQSLGEQLKAYARELCLAIALIIGGFGILKQQLWSRKVCLTALALAFFYGGNTIAWHWSNGQPSTAALSGAYALSFLFFGVWFIVLFQTLTEDNLKLKE